MGPRVLVAAAVVLYAIHMLVVGQAQASVPAVPLGQPQAPPTVVRVPWPPAVVPLVGAVLAIAGLLARRLSLAWAGVAILILFSGLFVFSGGGTFIPAAGLLLVLLIIQAAGRNPG